jgi:hypothetical protein
MKILYSTTLFVFLSIHLFSQNIYYGYPDDDKTLIKGDLFITNVPDNINGWFNKTEELDRLVGIVKNNPTDTFRIEINFFYFSFEANNDYSGSLSENLEKIFENAKTYNFVINSKGSTNPIFLDKSSENYKFYNTRLEIYIE